MKNIYIFRHGETDYNRNKILQGHLDIPLNANGIEQAKQLSFFISSLNLEVIHSSDLDRAIKTAKLAAPSTPIITSTQLRECFYGKYEGKTYKEILENEGEDFFLRWRSPLKEHLDFSFPNGESKKEVLNRILNYIQSVIGLKPEKTVGIASHGGVIVGLINYLENYPARPIQVSNCKCYHLQYWPSTKNLKFRDEIF